MRRIAATFFMISAALLAQNSSLELVSLTPPSGSGDRQIFRLTVGDGNGGRDIVSAGIYIGAQFDATRLSEACVVYADVRARQFSTALNSLCSVSQADSSVVANGDRSTVAFAVRFAPQFAGSKRIWAYANSAGDTRNTGWKEVGSWLVQQEPARASDQATAPSDPDAPTKELDRTDTDHDKLLRTNAGATELTHGKGVLRFSLPNGHKAAIAGPVTHQDLTTGQWAPNAPVLSETNQGWRVDGTSNGLVIRKKGLDQHTITQTFTDYTSKHDSTLTLTVPSLVYDKKQIFHFAQDGLTWDMTVDLTGAFNLAAKVATRQGPKTYTFDVKSSEAMAVDAKGNLTGDGNVKLSRATMYPKSGSPVACSPWAYSTRDGASFTCDDSGFSAAQLPYMIDPSTHTYTDTGTYYVSNDDPNSSGQDGVNIGFNTSGLIPFGGSLVSDSCGYNVTASGDGDAGAMHCSISGFNNSGTTTVTVAMGPPDSPGTERWAMFNNVTLTVVYTNGVTISVSPSTLTVPANPSQACLFSSQLAVTVDSPGTTAVNWSLAGAGSLQCGTSTNIFYVAPAAVDSNTTVTVTAQSVYDTSKTSSSTITVTPLPISVTVAPGSVSLQESQTQQFNATVVNRVTQTVAWSLSPAVGTISSSGLYTAPSVIPTGQTVTVKATSALDGTTYATATVTLVAGVVVTMAPTTATLSALQTQQFTPTVTGAANTAVTWSVSPAVGSVNGSGVYTAPTPINAQQTVTVTATSVANPSRSASATVTLIPLTISVSGASSMNPSQLSHFTATVQNGANGNVTWSVISGPGAINSAGWYTSPVTVAGATTVTVRATSVADPTKSGTATTTVNPWPAGTAYQYYVSDNFSSIDSTRWTANATISGGAQGLTGLPPWSGSVVSTTAVPDGSSDYDVQMTVHLDSTSQQWNTAYAVLARASADARLGVSGVPLYSTGTFYAFAMLNPWYSSYDHLPAFGWSATMNILKGSGGGTTILASFPYAVHDGMTMGIQVRGSSITVSIDSVYSYTLTDTSFASGAAGVSLMPSAYTGITNVKIGAIDTTSPTAVNAGGILSSAFPARVDLQWTGVSDDNAGSGLTGYKVLRDGVLLGTTRSPSFVDETVSAGANVTYSIVSFDRHGNEAAAAAKAVAVPSTGADQRRLGVRSTGSYWGAGREQIDLLSGNLNFSLPLVSMKSRGGWGTSLMLSYNSQIWRQEGSTSWKLGADVGYGLGWRLQAGSVTPVWFNGALLYCLFTDATGAEYRLDRVGSSSLFTSSQGVYVTYDSNAQTLFFPDGSNWQMGTQSSGLEDDAGTLYPSSMNDTNGNSLSIRYLPGLGSVLTNTSARIGVIEDMRAAGNSASGGFATHLFTYSGAPVPHLTAITSLPLQTENYTFEYGTIASLTSPFNGAGFGPASTLGRVVSTGVQTSNQFGYNASGEMTSMTTPLSGTLGWSYTPYTYTSASRTYDEVHTRTMSAGFGGMSNTWTISTASGASLHPSTTVSDSTANSTKQWWFETSAAATLGLATQFEESGPMGLPGAQTQGTILRKQYTWALDNGNTYIGTVITTANPGSNPVQAKSVQVLDANGNLTQQQVYDFGNLSTPTRTYNLTYVTNGNYTSRYIRNRLLTATVTPAGGAATTLVTNTYDGYGTGVCPPVSGLVDRTGQRLHDDTNYGIGFVYRGNLTYSSSMSGVSCKGYETTGVPKGSMDGSGQYVTASPDSSTGYSLPGVLMPEGSSSLATTVTYDSSWAVTSVTGPNGANGTTTYDAYGRPASTKIPDGAITNYSYQYAGLAGATANIQTAQIGVSTGARWKRTTLDGFGRVMKVESGHDSTVVSQVDTQYAACACSPLGKLWRVSQPYAPGGSPVWTTYYYDGSGRTVQVVAPDGSASTTEYLTTYGGVTGSHVRTTDPAGKWKVQSSDGMGNLVRVTEPNPAGGADLTTDYTYNMFGQMIQVQMVRTGTTQTRTFVYSGTDLTSTTNPENGTVTYQYDGAHHVTKRTDAKGQETRYVYDSYARLTQVQHWAWSTDANNNLVLTERLDQRYDYFYDTNPCDGSFSQNANGRLAAVQFAVSGVTGCRYQYSYNQAGRVTSQKLTMHTGRLGSALPQVFTAGYEWDNERRMTALQYPGSGGGLGPKYTYGFDAMGRVNAMTENATTQVGSISYGVAGEITSLGYFGVGESRTYNSLFQMTRQQVTGMMDMQYVFDTNGHNNGRIVKAIDGVAGETVDYTYDSLNRLTLAETEGAGGWGQSFTYDGFGNLNAKTRTKGVVGDVPEFNAPANPATNGGPTSYQHAVPDAFDVENRLFSGVNGSYTYDQANKRVMVFKDGAGAAAIWEVAFYGIGGQRLLTAACHYSYDLSGNESMGCDGPGYNVYFGGKLVKARGTVVVTDRLGSVRANGNGERFAYFPYGEERKQSNGTWTGDGREKFGSYVRDIGPGETGVVGGQDYADQRYYGVGTGRFNVPDPYQGSAGPAEPQSWNRYAYVLNDPVNRIDPYIVVDGVTAARFGSGSRVLVPMEVLVLECRHTKKVA